jgi:hypothetical protein
MKAAPQKGGDAEAMVEIRHEAARQFLFMLNM